MKRFLAGLVLAAVTLALVSGVADAAGARYRSGGFVLWRTHKAAIVGTESPGVNGAVNYGVDAAGGYVDSTGFYVPNAADGQDTSAVWVWPADMCMQAGRDSLPLLRVVVHNSAAGAAGDTLHLGPQVFLGGDQSVASNFIAVAAFPAVTNRVVTGAIKGGAVDIYPAGTSAAFAGSETAASTAPYTVMIMPGMAASQGLRLISYGDGTAAFTGGGRVTVEILYPVCE